MKKTLKIVGIIIVAVVLTYTLFIVEESIRLSLFDRLGEPLVVFEEEHTYSDTTYKSFGFTFKRSLYCKSDDLCFVNGLEFWLFDKFLIWGWIS